MTRIATALTLVLVLLLLGAEPSTVAARTGEIRVVVVLEAPPLAVAPEGVAQLAAEQRRFRAALADRIPTARIDWRYRLVTNGFALSLPSGHHEALDELPGVADVLEPAEYDVQLDDSPQQIGAPALWGPNLGTSGQGLKIGIIDTGIDARHPFFNPAGYTMPAGFPRGQARFTTAKVIVARAFPPPRARATGAALAFDGEQSSHGTHVAGIAAGNARTQASGRVVSGVAPRAHLGNYKALVRTDAGLTPNGNSPEIVAAIEAAVRDGMDVINLSIGEPEIEPSRDIVARALDAAAAAGVVPVVAAGNDYNDVGAGSISSPGNSARAITVGAVEIAGNPTSASLAEFSSVGPTTMSYRLKPDVTAPGVGILSAVPNGGWSPISGTSMAAPHVAGAAALLRQRHPAWTVAQVKSALVQSGSDVRDGRNRSLGPQFQGGGVVSLPGADRPLLLARPSGLSFGLVARSGRVSGAVVLEDAGAGAGTWQVSGVRSASAVGQADLSLPATVEVPGALPYELTASASAAEGDVAGFVELRRGNDLRRVPFWGRVTAPALGRHRTRALVRPGVYGATTRGRPALVARYRYPENPRGVGVTTVLRGPELVYRFRLTRPVANFGVVVTQRGPRSRVEPRVVARLDENRITGYAGLPVHFNPYLDGFRRPVPAAGALSPRAGEYGIVFDSPAPANAGRFTFRFWVNDTTPPTLRLRTPSVRAGRFVLVGATDTGSGVYPSSIRVRLGGRAMPYRFRNGIIRIPTAGLAPGRLRLEVRASDYQETKNTENVRRILPNTRTMTATVTIR